MRRTVDKKKLEAQRKQLQQEIKQINTLLFSNTKKKKSALTEVEDLAVKINLRQRLIRVTNEEANRLTQQINVNQRTIDRQRKELQALKDDYAAMIQYSYASKSGQSRTNVSFFIRQLSSSLQTFSIPQTVHQFSQATRGIDCRKDTHTSSAE